MIKIFENSNPSQELLDSLKEDEMILQDKSRKGYDNMEDLINSLNED